MCIMTYRRLYIFAIDKQNHLKICMFGVVGETHAHDSFELIWLYNLYIYIYIYIYMYIYIYIYILLIYPYSSPALPSH